MMCPEESGRSGWVTRLHLVGLLTPYLDVARIGAEHPLGSASLVAPGFDVDPGLLLKPTFPDSTPQTPILSGDCPAIWCTKMPLLADWGLDIIGFFALLRISNP